MMDIVRAVAKVVLRPIRPFLKRQGLGQWILGVADAPGLFVTYEQYLATGHTRAPGGWVWNGEFYPDYLTMGGNSHAIRRIALKHCQGRGIDIGASFWPLPGSLPIDTESGPGLANRIQDVPDGSQDFVFSSHCLEHIDTWEAALDVWVAKLKAEGILFLYLPHPSCGLWHVSNPFMKGQHRWAPSPEVIEEALLARGLSIVEKDEGPDHFYSFYYCAQR